jgi:flagellar biosynthesis/type III secretory pathway chaperone
MHSETSTTFDLCRLLEREEEACQALLDTVNQERAAIRTLAVTEFHTINSRRLAVLESLQRLTEERQSLVQRFAGEQGVASPTGSLHDVLDRVGDATAGTLRTRYNGYMATAKLVRQEIAHNVTLIEGIRGVVEQVLSAGARAVPGSDLYGQGGRAAPSPQGTVLLQQQA